MDGIKLEHKSLPYPEVLLGKWKKGDFSFLIESKASDYIKSILTKKAGARPGRRFFGEAFIVTNVDAVEGWYNSFKWLTGKKWITGRGLERQFEKPFYDALMKYVGRDGLKNLQKHSLRFFEKHMDHFKVGQVFRKPVAPDLWLIDKNGDFLFIESKLPGDTISPHQLVGLALIKKRMDTKKRVSVCIFSLYPDDKQKPETDYSAQFSKFCELA
ncbi:hypothetical protein ACFL4N_04080 [Thermodesulfobacteriota bacterium]